MSKVFEKQNIAINTLVIALYIANRVLPSSISCEAGDGDAEKVEDVVAT